MKTPLLSLMIALGLAGCGGARPENATNVTNAAANAVDMTSIPEDSDAVALDNGGANAVPGTDTVLTDAWMGRWTGPEGLFLDIKPGTVPGSYALTLKDSLDSQASYTGTADAGTIRFIRNGKGEIIRAGTGKQTGYKWLADKTECLIIIAGKEGYCR